VRDLGVTIAAAIAVPAISSATFDLLGFSVATGFTFLLIGAAGSLWRTVREGELDQDFLTTRPTKGEVPA
ncbi:MAG: hypothetical protein M3548_21220, partial [Actinomycetota bacterium]|nr:hypothetical protein [Actinomycetota bacterium]